MVVITGLYLFSFITNKNGSLLVHWFITTIFRPKGLTKGFFKKRKGRDIKEVLFVTRMLFVQQIIIYHITFDQMLHQQVLLVSGKSCYDT
ncbi:hypothetical protein RhiirA4_254323 [Rhizophagus irregularis]|uniref:Uncharacterized protein n=1 Tax=Rhizophagus irregularis TaxID=588596 RepID=A0A2I1FZS1_9GLOM|nr:hypothetical protein RhiirA4_254323 [Rhizophagus irregularis]